jgi:multiple sugar transport system permease protein
VSFVEEPLFRYSEALRDIDMRRIDYLFLIPALVVLVALVALPLGQVIAQSLTNTKLLATSRQFVGLANYLKLVRDKRFWNSVNVTLLLAGISLVLQIGLGLGLAVLVQKDFALSRLGRSLFVVPIVLPPVVVAIVWRLLFSAVLPGINYYLSLVGIEGPAWFDHSWSARFAIIIAHAWYCVPYVMLMLLAGLESLPEEPVSAAYVDGANGWQIFLYITLPMLKPVLIFTTIYRAVQALKIFGLVYIMTGGGPGVATEPMSYHIWRIGFAAYKVGYASAIAVMMFLLILLIVLAMGWYGRRTEAIR